MKKTSHSLPMNIKKREYHVSEVADICGVSKETVRRWDNSGKLTALREGESDYRVYSRDQLLQFDEVDTFLAERQSSRQGWEASMVNEMLVQLETFQGIFIASTNILDRLDEASLRRFDLVVKFDALRGEHAQRLFLEMCDQLQLGGPSAQTLERLKNCNGLTPGDFHQQRRQAKFSPPTTSEELGQRLIDTSTRKHTYRKAPMGFTAVH